MPPDTDALFREIALEVEKLYSGLVDPIAKKFSFEGRPTKGEVTGPPSVLFLGNHSSGKSTFINALLGRPVQKTGVAPTDDSFTVIAYADREEERDGHAVVSNPDLPYEPLRGFGPTFLSHLKLKTVPSDLLEKVTLIDSPGMIDAAREDSGRGYDFTAVVRWFALRADLILFFFDPDKPGTTGETLKVFVEALSDLGHKLRIVMNKVDLFESLRDFARAYGALCWNLGKVIPTKDLPIIFTTYVPEEANRRPPLPAQDFDLAREELVEEIRRTPARRMDNLLTRLQEDAERLRMHAQISSRARSEWRRSRFLLRTGWAGILLLLVLAAAISIDARAAWWLPATIVLVGALFAFLGWHATNGLLRSQEEALRSGLTRLFEDVYVKELLLRDQARDLRSMWDALRPRTEKILATLGLGHVPRLTAAEAAALLRLSEEEVPRLRSMLHRALGVTRTVSNG